MTHEEQDCLYKCVRCKKSVGCWGEGEMFPCNRGCCKGSGNCSLDILGKNPDFDDFNFFTELLLLELKGVVDEKAKTCS